MNEKIEFRFRGIEVSDNLFFVVILNWHIPQYKITEPSDNTEYLIRFIDMW